MLEFQLTKPNIEELFNLLISELEKDGVLNVKVEKAGTGKWGMARLWRSWMSTTAKYMADRGAKMPLMIKKDGSWYGERPFNSADAHELFVSKWLGVDANGNRLSWAKNAHDGMRPATKGERFLAMQKHEDWSTSKGIILFKPRDSEYLKVELETEQ